MVLIFDFDFQKDSNRRMKEKNCLNHCNVMSSFFHSYLDQTTMARSRSLSFKYEMLYKIEFTGPVRGHHIYKDCWTPVIGEKLICKSDPREEAKTYDKHALGVYKFVDGESILVGHVPIELSRLLSFFLTTDMEKKKTCEQK